MQAAARHGGMIENGAMFRPPRTRYQRQRSRRRFEEIASWILLPIVIVVGWWIVTQVINAWDVPTATLLPNR